MMKLRAELIKGIQEFLDSVPLGTLRRGQHYFDRGMVESLECVAPNHLFAAVVRGGAEYEVGLEFADGDWAGECSCPVGFDCKHMVAAMLAMQQLAEPDPVSNPNPRKASSAAREPVAEAARAKMAQQVPQPPKSPLRDTLVEKLGRKLTRVEADFVRRAQEAFDTARVRPLTESNLAVLSKDSTLAFSANYWQALELWPEFPANDFLFWQFIAWELRRRDWAYPPFMDAATDLGLIEPAMKNWERAKEIARWEDWFREFEKQTPPEPVFVELRLAIFAEEARLQWRTSANAPFTVVKQTHAKKLSEQFDQAALNISPESLPLWSAVYRPWHYESWWSFDYADGPSIQGLNRLLRLALPPDRVVTADGQPLTRHAEPLRLVLSVCDDGNETASRPETYELKLVTASGAAPPKIRCALRGRPTLYLTDGGLFTGPPAYLLEKESRQVIPAAAVETTGGLRFLQAIQVPPPEHLAARVRTIPVKVTVSCGLKSPYGDGRSEDLVISVTAKAPGMKTETFRAQGWEDQNRDFGNTNAKPEKTESADSGAILLYDRAAQNHFPKVFDWLPGVKYNGWNYGWTLRLGKKTPELFVDWLKLLPPEIEVLLDGELATLRDQPVSGSVSLDVAEAGMDWFDLKVALNVGDTTLTAEELKLLFNARGGYVRLGKKGWRRLQFNLTPEDDEQLARLGLDARDFSAEPQRFHALQLADDAAKKFLAPERVEKIQRRVSELKTRVTPALPAGIQAEMRPYQTDGFHFLSYLTANHFGGVLADDMGLGKTLQTLAWLAWLRENAGASPQCSLVVCPKSVMDNWRAEAARFYPALRVRLWRGEDQEELEQARKNWDLIVVNYSQLRSLYPDVARAPWLAVILDEAQYIKNPDSQTAQSARALKAAHRLALTGTPIENRLLDLWSILAFAMPGALGSRAHFLRRFNAKDDSLARRRLAARVRPFLLRRAKSQVAKDLPDRAEEDLICDMEGEQKTLYRAELKRARQILLKLQNNQQLNAERFTILTSLLRLRQICCHPALVDGALREAESAKLSALEDLLEPLMEEGHKVLVFSQFVTMLDLLREKVEARGWPQFYLAGHTENRGELVKEFQAAKGGAVFLISLKAGGFGLNLTAASYVVLFDPWWNPAVENQAIDRTHRIGQTSKVMAYRLIIRESIEEKIRALQKQKAALAADVLGEENFTQTLTLDDLKFLFAE